MKRIAIIGHFGGEEKFWDGQTVKTKNLEEILLGQTNLSVRRVDTYYAKRNKVKLLLNTILALFCCEHIFLLVAPNGMKVFLPLLYYLNQLTKKHIYHYIVGSEILELVRENRRWINYLNSFEENWFEFDSGTCRLRQLGVKNVVTVPNFKKITPVSAVCEYHVAEQGFRFCTFSRVMREKGITDAIDAVSRINEERKDKVVFLDIYGPIDPLYQDEFERLLTTHAAYVTYRGCVDSQKSVDVLKDYYALLFPTRWAGEGMPGTIIDTFASGLPVIATDWNANKEIIEHMQTGILYPSDEFDTLYDAMVWSIEHANTVNHMRVKCRKQFEKYMPETILAFVLNAMNEASEVTRAKN